MSTERPATVDVLTHYSFVLFEVHSWWNYTAGCYRFTRVSAEAADVNKLCLAFACSILYSSWSTVLTEGCSKARGQNSEYCKWVEIWGFTCTNPKQKKKIVSSLSILPSDYCSRSRVLWQKTHRQKQSWGFNKNTEHQRSSSDKQWQVTQYIQIHPDFSKENVQKPTVQKSK